MTHPRKKIRDEIKRRLTGSTAAGSRVFTNRATPLFDQDYPLILIYTLTDSAEKYQEAPLMYRRDLTVGLDLVEGQVDEATDDALDALAVEVETVMGDAMADYLQEPGGDSLVMDLQLGQCRVGITEQGGEHFASLKMEYTASYLQAIPDEAQAAALDDFAEAGIDYNNHDDAATLATDEIQLEVE